MKDPSLQFIVERETGFQVRFQRKAGRVQRLFTFADHAGRRATLAAAKAWRDEQVRKLGLRGERTGRAVPGHGRVRRGWKHGRRAWESWMWTEHHALVRTQNIIDVWGSGVAKQRCEKWLARQRRALAARQGGR